MISKAAADHLNLLLKYYTRRKKELYGLIDLSSTAFTEYIAVTDFLQELRILYYKINAKEYNYES